MDWVSITLTFEQQKSLLLLPQSSGGPGFLISPASAPSEEMKAGITIFAPDLHN